MQEIDKDVKAQLRGYIEVTNTVSTVGKGLTYRSNAAGMALYRTGQGERGQIVVSRGCVRKVFFIISQRTWVYTRKGLPI